MKLTILGGAGMRTPLLIEGLFKQNDLHFKEVTLFDIDEERLSVMGRISRFLVDKYQGDFILSFTTDIKEAVRGADFIFSAIRVGQEEGRVLDEQIALKYGVLGQETTGPGDLPWGCGRFPSCSNTPGLSTRKLRKPGF